MCFIKKSSIDVSQETSQDTIQRHQADASLTKNSQNENAQKGYLQNLKTTPIGLVDDAKTEKKTLLGE